MSTPNTKLTKEEIAAQWRAIMTKRGGMLWGFCPEARQRLHLRACWMLGYNEPLAYSSRVEALWVEFEMSGHGPDELRDVIRYREKQRKAGKASYGRGLLALLADMTAFDEQLAAARKRQGDARPDTIEITQKLEGGGERRVEIPFPVTIPAALDRETALAQIEEWRQKRKAMMGGTPAE
jgi:hypothetical protein